MRSTPRPTVTDTTANVHASSIQRRDGLSTPRRKSTSTVETRPPTIDRPTRVNSAESPTEALFQYSCDEAMAATVAAANSTDHSADIGLMPPDMA